MNDADSVLCPSYFLFKKYLGIIVLSIAVLLMISCGGSSRKKGEPISIDHDPPALGVGHAFYYQHTGPRPWSNGSQDASGGRLLVIPEQDASQAKSLIKYEEHFESSEGSQVGYIDKKYRLHQKDIESGDLALKFIYSPALELRYIDLKKDKLKTFKSSFNLHAPGSETPQGSGNIITKVKRSYDVRIISPAGAYLCRQFMSDVTIETKVLDVQTVFKAKKITYWCDNIGWFVKEEYAFEPMLRNGKAVQAAYRAESILSKYKPMDPNSLRPVE